jgi:hypothetical protein
MDIAGQIQKLILDAIKEAAPIAAKKRKMSDTLIDRSTKTMGMSRILKDRYTP